MQTETERQEPPRQTRRDRERVELRERIVLTALAIARTDGWANVSMRGIAEAIEYSAPSLYYHFASRDELVYQVRRHGYALFLERLSTVDEGDPVQRIVAMSAHHVEFAFANPELFSAMFGLRGAPPPAGEAGPEQTRVAELIDEAVREILGEDVAGSVFDDAVDMIWASMHGIVSLSLYGPIPGGIERAHRMSRLAMESYLSALTGSGYKSADHFPPGRPV